MDHFGIGAAMKAMVVTYIYAARRTGRTTSLVESVQNGDRICCATGQEARRVAQLCEERGLTVDCIVVAPGDPTSLLDRGTSKGRTIFDHTWVELYYQAQIERAERDIDQLQRETSGYGTAHIETRRQYEELAKWSAR